MRPPHRSTFPWKPALAVLVLALQLAGIAAARFRPERYFAWAPHDEQAEYAIEAEVRGRPLSGREIVDRYQYAPSGVEPRAVAHIFRQIRAYETRHGTGDGAGVRVRYRLNGGPEETWSWPPAPPQP